MHQKHLDSSEKEKQNLNYETMNSSYDILKSISLWKKTQPQKGKMIQNRNEVYNVEKSFEDWRIS